MGDLDHTATAGQSQAAHFVVNLGQTAGDHTLKAGAPAAEPDWQRRGVTTTDVDHELTRKTQR
jgi:hypothetical protein